MVADHLRQLKVWANPQRPLSLFPDFHDREGLVLARPPPLTFTKYWAAIIVTKDDERIGAMISDRETEIAQKCDLKPIQNFADLDQNFIQAADFSVGSANAMANRLPYQN